MQPRTAFRATTRALTVSLCLPAALAALPFLSGCQPKATAAGAAAGDQKPPAAAAGGPVFAEAAAQSGIDYKWEVAGKRPLNILQTIGNGCAFLDYDGDGSLDVLLVGPKVSLYRGDGKGKFADVSAEAGVEALKGNFLGCAVGDYDNDGRSDVYLTAYRGGALLHNEGGKSLKNVSAAAGIPNIPWGTSASFSDLDGDGRLDLYVCNYVQFGPNTDPQLCNNSGLMSACGPRFYQAEKGRVYRNVGGGKFQDVTAPTGAAVVTGKGLGVAVADFDDAGRPGIAVANDEMPGDLLQPKAGGKYENVGTLSGTAYDANGSVHGGMGIDWGDYNNDGKIDLAVGTFQRETKCVYRNDGGGTFTEASALLGITSPTPYVTFGLKWLDADNDGWLDLALANGHVQDNINAIDKTAEYRQPITLLRSQGGTLFEDVTARLPEGARKPVVGRGLAVGDYDNDGRPDLLVVDSEGAPLLLHNETPNAGHWLLLNLKGRKSNRDGIGARVVIQAGGQAIHRRCATDGSYMSASDRRVHVGLGTATMADQVTVTWPSGKKTELKDVKADQVLTVEEPD